MGLKRVMGTKSCICFPSDRLQGNTETCCFLQRTFEGTKRRRKWRRWRRRRWKKKKYIAYLGAGQLRWYAD